ncbi:MAG: hypothetical protein A2817_03145 [Candidatus Yanofskybacteria bacterium RIFCSPHIGHO2_01_FULL_39_8b]|uniref:Uncharacterized protein n=1 Tax=Candidatus Yanofskybacteria bacterium RIFCSPHIGHO2_01_FULL_39_8b TaxID=1802659 RepID=A0A1F8EG89_9BACT|nr:MAG: hypothetical protein A2817_03145 [Candidatus Yanofskybacteria bacterium RIFCSPHIGHO2_01_FULL_39_8b]
MKRTVLSIIALIFSGLLVFPAFGQERQRSQRRPPQGQERAVPRDRPRVIPRPPQRYVPNYRNYQRQYHYNGRWRNQMPQFYQRGYRYPYRYNRGWGVTVCQPGYWVFLGYDYWGRSLYNWVPEYCYRY